MIKKIMYRKYAKYFLFLLMVSFYSSSPLNAMLGEEEVTKHLVTTQPRHSEQEAKEKERNKTNIYNLKAEQAFLFNEEDPDGTPAGTGTSTININQYNVKADQAFLFHAPCRTQVEAGAGNITIININMYNVTADQAFLFHEEAPGPQKGSTMYNVKADQTSLWGFPGCCIIQ